MYKPGVVVLIVLVVRDMILANIFGMYELVKKYSKARSMAEHGRARQSTTLRPAELALRCGALLSLASGHRRALHGGALV